MIKTNSYKRSTYSYWFGEKILFIEDNDQGGMSVTNNIEGILDKIESDEGKDITSYNIVYQDSEGIWDRIIANRNNGKITVSFVYLGCKTWEEAQEKVNLKLIDKHK